MTQNAHPPTPRMTVQELSAFLDVTFPPETRPSLGEIVGIAPGSVRMSLQRPRECCAPAASYPARR